MLVTLALGGMMTIVAIAVHLAGILLLLHLLRRNAHQATAAKNGRDLARQLALIVAVTLGIFIVHGVEIWLYAFAYVLSGALPDLPTAVYFSAVSYSTLGFGDIVLGPEWRIFGAFEGVTGLILIGWSSAFLLSVTSRLRMLEHDWEAYAKRAQPKRKRQ
jgi:voltage-gated potassium channel